MKTEEGICKRLGIFSCYYVMYIFAKCKKDSRYEF